MSAPLIAVLLAGGAGSRLWPASRQSRPKPLFRLSGGESLLQRTAARAVGLEGLTALWVVTAEDLAQQASAQLREVSTLGVPVTLLLEPVGRHTAAAVTAAAAYAQTVAPDATLLFLPADHHIESPQVFFRAARDAVARARAGAVTLFGIPAQEHGLEDPAQACRFGHITLDAQRDVRRFVEKPSADHIAEIPRDGLTFWNSGMVCAQATTLLEEVRVFEPALFRGVTASLARARTTCEELGYAQVHLDAESFGQVPALAFDIAVLERSSRLAMVPCEKMGWSDIGTWDALATLFPQDPQGNRVQGDVVLEDATHMTVLSEDRVVAAVGVKDLIVVDTPDAVLITTASRAGDVRQVYDRLAKAGHPTHRIHQTVERSWGTYTVLQTGPGFKVKRLVVKPGKSLSMQRHFHRSEHWVVVSGMAEVHHEEAQGYLRENESTFIPVCDWHRLSNPGKIDLVMIEVQVGVLTDESDIERRDPDRRPDLDRLPIAQPCVSRATCPT